MASELRTKERTGIENKLAEGLEVEHDLDSFLADWEKNRLPAKPSILKRIQSTAIAAVGQAKTLTPGIALAGSAGVYLLYLSLCWFFAAQIGWHPHPRSEDCIQYRDTEMRICLSHNAYSSFLYERTNMRGGRETCIMGKWICKFEAIADLNETAKFRKELGQKGPTP